MFRKFKFDSLNEKLDATLKRADAITLNEFNSKCRGFHLEALAGNNESRKQDRKLRGKYAKYILWFVCGYLIAALVLIICQPWLQTHDNVMMVFLGTTVVNTIGLLNGVIRYLFNHP